MSIFHFDEAAFYNSLVEKHDCTIFGNVPIIEHQSNTPKMNVVWHNEGKHC
jgi:hypothetical protein